MLLCRTPFPTSEMDARSKDVLLYDDRYKEFADKLIAEADVICCLDFNAIHRIDAMGDAVLASARKILIDHHLHPRISARLSFPIRRYLPLRNWFSRLICRMGYFSDISREGAECIYTGMMTDTRRVYLQFNNRKSISSSANCCRKVLTRTRFTARCSILIQKSRFAPNGICLVTNEGLSGLSCSLNFSD